MENDAWCHATQTFVFFFTINVWWLSKKMYICNLLNCLKLGECKTKYITAMDFIKVLLKLVGLAKEYIDESPKQAAPARQPRYEPRQEEPVVVEREKTAEEWEAYFREILSSEFSAYSVREKVPVTEIAGFANDEFKLYKKRPYQAYKAEWGQPYTFVLEKDGKAKGVVMLGNGHSHYNNVKYLIARVYAKKLGVPYINFYTQMENERGYVIGRIRKFLNGEA